MQSQQVLRNREADDGQPRVEILLLGEEDGRRGSKRMVAFTECTIRFTDEANLLRCVEALRESDIALRNRPEEQMLWDWKVTMRTGMDITFGVSWYDADFYRRRRDAFKNPQHMLQYLKFGASLTDFEVRHFIAD